MIQKIGEGKIVDDMLMRIQVFDRIFDKLPTLDDVQRERILPLDFLSNIKNNNYPLSTNYYIHMHKKKEYPESYLTFLGNMKGPENKVLDQRLLSWYNVDECFCLFYDIWHEIDYELTTDGAFEYNGL